MINCSLKFTLALKCVKGTHPERLSDKTKRHEGKKFCEVIHLFCPVNLLHGNHGLMSDMRIRIKSEHQARTIKRLVLIRPVKGIMSTQGHTGREFSFYSGFTRNIKEKLN